MSSAGRIVSAAMAMALMLLAVSPAPGRATDDLVWLPGHSLGAIGFDVDGDGDNELIRLVAEHANVLLDVWDLVGGRWVALGAPVMARPGSDRPEGGTESLVS